jgi:hypothetical protein
MHRQPPGGGFVLYEYRKGSFLAFRRWGCWCCWFILSVCVSASYCALRPPPSLLGKGADGLCSPLHVLVLVLWQGRPTSIKSIQRHCRPHRMAARAPCLPGLPLSSGAADDQQSSLRARFDKRAKRVGKAATAFIASIKQIQIKHTASTYIYVHTTPLLLLSALGSPGHVIEEEVGVPGRAYGGRREVTRLRARQRHLCWIASVCVSVAEVY